MQKSGQKIDSYRHQLRSTLYVFIVLALVIFSVEAMSAETAAILPKKVSRFRIVGIQTAAVSDKLNTNGRLEPMANGLNQSLNAHDLAKDPQLKQLVDGVGTLDAQMAEQLVGAELRGDFRMHATQIIPCYEYGLTENFNIGIRVPIVRRKVEASFRASYVNNAHAVQKKLKGLNQQLDDGLAQLAAADLKLNTAFFNQQVFTSKGYDTPHNFENVGLGDIEVGGKYLMYKNEYWTSSLQAGIRLPTGSRPSQTNIFDTGTGNGTWATGAYLYNDFHPTSRWIIGTAVKGIYNLPDKYNAAVPKDANDSLPSLLPADGQVQNVQRLSGLEYNGEISSTLKLFNNAVTPWVAYQWAQHGIDKYSGPGTLYYQGLEQGTDYTKHALEIGAGYSTVPAFVAKKASIPFTIEGLYNRTFAGRNTPMLSYVRLDLIGYF